MAEISRLGTETAIKNCLKSSRRAQRVLGAVGVAAGIVFGLHAGDQNSSLEEAAPLLAVAAAAGLAGGERLHAKRSAEKLVSDYADRHRRDGGRPDPLLQTFLVIKDGEVRGEIRRIDWSAHDPHSGSVGMMAWAPLVILLVASSAL